ncbi:arylsulfatase [Luteolibacter algae]|uniref:Arylsulfatase n=1 Tax=Luteolibacter algae TaxID=454151 RepID=A0ABW5D958_9BACT
MVKKLASILFCLVAASAAQARQPNIIYILADDLGYGDVSYNGQDKFRTPNIDALAEQGMRFTNHYSGSAVCAPSRASFLTGRHTGNAPVRGNAEHPPEGQTPMPEDTYTLAHHLKKAGYKTGIFGKWGLGYPGSVSEPLKMGFDKFYGYNCQYLAHSYYPAWLWNDDKREFLWGNVGSFSKDYAPEFIHKQTLDFIRENKDKPFFCYYALVQPHADMIAPEEYMEKYRGKFLPEFEYKEDYYKGQPEGHAAFAAMVNVLDDYVGELVAELKELGIAEDTLVIFTSDNGAHEEGGADPVYFDSSSGRRGFKRDLYEGGIHVPMVASWPGKIAAGSESDQISAFWDMLPTFAELANEPLTVETDGVSIVPTLLGEDGQKQHDFLYWEFHAKKGMVAIRKGDWKGVRYDVSVDPDSPLELYNIAKDPGEKNNVAAEHPEMVEEFNKFIKQSHTTSPNPEWNFPTSGKKKK